VCGRKGETRGKHGQGTALLQAKPTGAAALILAAYLGHDFMPFVLIHQLFDRSLSVIFREEGRKEEEEEEEVSIYLLPPDWTISFICTHTHIGTR
jgi:hypothetical protein